jgi:hypothetical protein
LRAIVALALVIGIVSGVPTGADDDCGPIGQYGGTCTGTNAGDHVDVGGHTGSDGAGTGTDAATGDDSDDPSTPATPKDPCSTAGITCLGASGFDATYPDVGMSDLASFYPARPTVAGEPNGWAVIGLDANFVASAKAHTASGPLLGVQADVRFTPVTFRWGYGDGIRSTTTTGGRTWKALGVPEFSPTATSHIYAKSGTYALDVAVIYTAQFRVGGGAWRDIPGTLSLSAPTSTVVAGDAATVLVQRTCQSDPHAVGC